MSTSSTRQAGPAETVPAPPKPPITKVTPVSYKNTIKDLEVKDGANSKQRGIKLTVVVEVEREKVKKTEQQVLQCVYRFVPDPHAETRYIKKPEEFYQHVAHDLVAHVKTAKKLPEPTDKFTTRFGKTDFTLAQLQHEIGHGFKIKTAPDGPEIPG
ncbi:hypothetical protein ACFVGY_15765 [Streptomyces sp. NPDC127106]|uniref:hypothetical protein n=1 Tax=Streptomyces sp. NPDC127106 TaxID=3345360 RepID=UPI00363B6922